MKFPHSFLEIRYLQKAEGRTNKQSKSSQQHMVRLKRRFIVFQIRTADPLNTYSPDSEDLKSALQQSFQSMYGIFGCGHVWSTLKIILWEQAKNFGVFRVPRDWSERFVLFLSTITSLNNVELHFVVHHVSGTIDQAQRWLDENSFVIE